MVAITFSPTVHTYIIGTSDKRTCASNIHYTIDMIDIDRHSLSQVFGRIKLYKKDLEIFFSVYFRKLSRF